MATSSILLVAAGCALVLAAKLRQLYRAGNDKSLRALCLFLTGLTVSVGLQPFVPAIDRITGVQMLGGFLGECAVLLAASAGQVFLARVHHPPESVRAAGRGPYRVLVVTVAAMAVIFVLGPTDWEIPPGTTGAALGHLAVLPRPYLYLYLYSGYLLVTLVAVTGMCLRYAPLTKRPELRCALRVLTVACIAGIGYTLTSFVSDTLFEFSVDVDSWESATITPLYLVTDALLAIGCAIPAVAALLARARRRLADHRARRRLKPLWQALRSATPDIALFPANAQTGLGMNLYRQVIEIRDGQLALRSYVSTSVIDTASALSAQAGLTAEQTRSVVEAATISAAIAAKLSGQEPRSPLPLPASASGGADFTAEVAWLQQVSSAFQHSPIVARTLATAAGSVNSADASHVRS